MCVSTRGGGHAGGIIQTFEDYPPVCASTLDLLRLPVVPRQREGAHLNFLRRVRSDQAGGFRHDAAGDRAVTK